MRLVLDFLIRNLTRAKMNTLILFENRYCKGFILQYKKDYYYAK